MERITNEAITELLNSQERPSVTIYMPVHVSAAPPHITENQIRLKNLINKATHELQTHGTEGTVRDALCQQLESLSNDVNFWEEQTPGLLICANSQGLHMFNIPIDTEEYVAVDECFHLAPIIGILSDAHEYYVLKIAQQKPMLYRGDMYGVQPAGINLPESVEQGLNIDENNQKSENQGSATGLSTSTGWFNGRGGARNPQEEDRIRFFRMIDQILCDKADRKLPVVLAGIEAETVEYRNLSKYSKLLTGTIAGSHADLEMNDLHAKAEAIVRAEIIEPDHRSAIEEFERLSGANPSRVAVNENTIKDAAEQGRVDKLLTSMIRKTADTVRDTSEEVLRITFLGQAEANRALNMLALQVWQMSGRVLTLQPQEMPAGRTVVARLRY
jgi:hypothetical protein